MSDKRTCLYEKHLALSAKMVPFGGFEMPLQYSDITDEHNAVRQACGVFDVSHMGEVFVEGREAEKFVQYIFTNNIEGAEIGKIYYGMMLHDNGGTVDDLLVYKMADEKFLLVVNAANIDKDYAWIEQHAKGFDVTTVNASESYGQIAIQGPNAEAVCERILQLSCSELAFYTFKETEHHGETIIVSRTGYTGEDGFELYGSHAYINKVWDVLIASGEVLPCGLGCRDTLRFEVALPLYGHELSDTITPLEAGLGMFAKVKEKDFIGRDALVAQKETGLTRKIVGIELQDKAIPRAGYPVEVDGVQVGEVTTGYRSISTDRSVCVAMVDKAYTELGTAVEIRIRKKVFPGIVTKKRFCETNYKK